MANEFIISPYAISFESIKNSLQNYVAQKSQTDDVWKDFYVSSTGETIIELAAALGAFYGFQFIAGRRENFIAYAQNYTSVIGQAQNLGYSAKRGNNLKLNVTILPNQTILNLPKWTVVGSYAEYDIVLLEDVTLNTGVPVTLPVVIGNSMIETYSIKSSELSVFNFLSPNVTDDCRLILNTTEVPTSTLIQDAIDDKYITISNVYGALDAFYLNQGNYKYQGGNSLYLNFIERNNLDFNKITNSQIVILYTDEDATNVSLLSDRTDKEDIEKVRVAAPLFHQNSNLIRSRRDYKDYLLVNDLNLVDTNDKDIYPGLIEITYLKNDKSLMNSIEKSSWLSEIDYLRPGGVAEAVISDPQQINTTLNINLYKQLDISSLSTTLEQDVANIIKPYENKLGIEFDTSQIEHDLEALEGIKIARVGIPTSTWAANTIFDQYKFVSTSSGNYYVSKIIHYSDATEPTWSSLTSVGDTLIDNEIIWQRVSKYPENEVNSWTASTGYYINDCIIETVSTENRAFKVIGYVGKTGSTEPVWVADEVIDNNITWQKTSTTSTDTWDDNTEFDADDIIKVVIGSTNYYYKALNDGVSGSTEPSWLKNEVSDFNIVWQLTTSTTSTTWSATTNKKVGDLIKVVSDGNNYYYQVITLKGNSGATEPTWSSLTNLSDGNLIWSPHNEVNTTIDLEWNQYLKINYTLTVQ